MVLILNLVMLVLVLIGMFVVVVFRIGCSVGHRRQWLLAAGNGSGCCTRWGRGSRVDADVAGVSEGDGVDGDQ